MMRWSRGKEDRPPLQCHCNNDEPLGGVEREGGVFISLIMSFWEVLELFTREHTCRAELELAKFLIPSLAHISLITALLPGANVLS